LQQVHGNQAVSRLIQANRDAVIIQRAYLEPDPVSPIIRSDREFHIRLRGSRDDEPVRLRGETSPDAPAILTIESPSGARQFDWPLGSGPVRVPFREPGRHRLELTGCRWTGSLGLANRGPRITVDYELFVAPYANAEALAQSREISSHDATRSQDRGASRAELLLLFRRLAIRTALETLTDNKTEALRYQRLYHGESDTPDMQERLALVSAISDLYRALVTRGRQNNQILQSPVEAYVPGVAERSPRYRERLSAQNAELNSICAMIVAAFPEAAAVERHGNAERARNPQRMRTAVLEAVDAVMQTIDETRYKLVTGDFDVLEADLIVNRTLREYGGNPTMEQAVREHLAQQERSETLVRLGAGTVQIGLLFVPYVGPVLAAALGTAIAVHDIARALRLRTAEGAGMVQGVVSRQRANAATIEAIVSTTTAATDVVAAVASLARLRAVLRGSPGAPTEAPPPASASRQAGPTMLQRQRAVALRREALELERGAHRFEERGRQMLRARSPTVRDEAQNLLAQARDARARARTLREQAGQYARGHGPTTDVVPEAHEVDELFDRLVREGSPDSQLHQIRLGPQERNPAELARLARQLMRSRSGNRVVFRVEGGGGRELVAVNGGQVTIQRPPSADGYIHLNFGSEERALEFLREHRPGGRIVAFEVDEAWVQSLRSSAIPQSGTTGMRGVPRLVDVRMADDQIELPIGLLDELEEFLIQGSGRTLVVD
jgi:hypothetical protein